MTAEGNGADRHLFLHADINGQALCDGRVLDLARVAGCHWLPLVATGDKLFFEGVEGMDQLERDEALCAFAKVQLYCNSATSEVTAEHPTLHDAVTAATPSIRGSVLICDGVILATAAAGGWLFEQAGIERLHGEFNASLLAPK